MLCKIFCVDMQGNILGTRLIRAENVYEAVNSEEAGDLIEDISSDGTVVDDCYAEQVEEE